MAYSMFVHRFWMAPRVYMSTTGSSLKQWGSSREKPLYVRTTSLVALD